MKRIILLLLISCISYVSSAAIGDITGTLSVCVGGSTNLSNTTAGGNWTSSAMSIATVGTDGTVTGIAIGTSTIFYTVGTDSTAKTVTVNPLPTNIIGPNSVCESNSINLSDAGNGSWSSKNSSVATIGSKNGIVNGLSSGTSIITYKLASGCFTTIVETVSPSPASISGQLNICLSSPITLSDAPSNGTWSSSSAVITIGSTGVATGVAAGSSIITYTLSTGCYKTTTLNAFSSPPSISGNTKISIDKHTNLSNVLGGGTWSTSNSAVAVLAPLDGSVGSEVVVFGVKKGTATITYSTCNADTIITVKVDSTRKIAQSRLQIFGALYSTPGKIKADDPNLTQTYVRFNIPIKELHGIDYDATDSARCIFFRNIFTQLTYTTNANNTNYIDSTSYSTNKLTPRTNYRPLDTVSLARHVNRLDLLESANFNLNITLPVFTYVMPLLNNKEKRHRGDFAHIYVEPFCSLLSTTVSRTNDTANNITVYSLQPGFDIGMRTEHMVLSGVPLFLELTSKIFWIVPLSNSISPDLNYQYSRIADYNVTIPGKHLLDPSNHPYYNFDALIIYNTNKDNSDSSSNVFAHFSFFTNIVRPTTSARGHVFNNFMQLQVGYGLNISTFISQIQKKATSSSASTDDADN